MGEKDPRHETYNTPDFVHPWYQLDYLNRMLIVDPIDSGFGVSKNHSKRDLFSKGKV